MASVAAVAGGTGGAGPLGAGSGPGGGSGEAAAGCARSVSESISRHNPPNSSICSTGSANADRLVYTSGRVMASTSAAAGAHCGPASPARPPKASTASAPRTGLTSAAPLIPCSQNPPLSSIGSPGSDRGYSASPWASSPDVVNDRPGWGPPNAPIRAGIGSEPCWEIQYPAAKAAPGARLATIVTELTACCHTPNPTATRAVPASPNQAGQRLPRRGPGSSVGH